MAWRNNSERYGSIAMLLHWSIMLLFLCLVTLGLVMTQMEDGSDKWALYSLHKSFGALTALLIVLRIIWRFVSPPPPLPSTLAAYEKWLAHAVHIGLYAVMIVLPISGYIDSSAGGYKFEFFGLFPIPKLIEKSPELEHLALNIHVYATYTFYALFALHIGGVLKHQLILRDNTLARMLPGKH